MTLTFAPTAPISKETFTPRVIAIFRSSNDVELDALPEGVRRLAPDAFRTLYESLADGLNSFAFSILRDRASAEDAVQQAFLELVKAAPSIRGDGRSLRAWLFRSVRFRCLDEIRRRQRRREVLHGEVPDLVSPSVPPQGAGGDLEAALSELTDRQRAVLFLRHVMGMSGHEVASILEINRAAVFATASRAERRLRRLLGDEHPAQRSA